jgi:hypothetical protein
VAARGRWGYRGLRTVLAVRRVTPAVGIAAGRVLRRWYRTQVRVQRVDHAAGRVYYRSCRKRKRLFRHNRGFLTVNDGPAFVFQLARYLAGLEPPVNGRAAIASPCRIGPLTRPKAKLVRSA